MMSRLRIGVIGAGRVGAVLAARLRAAGYPIAAVSARSEASQIRVATLLPGVEIAEPESVVRACDALILAVPDDNLIRVAEELAVDIHPGQFVLHTSGRHGLDALAALSRQGGRPIAFHPAMTFTGTQVDLDRTCVFGLTAAGHDRAFAEELVRALGCASMWISETDRIRYHAALAHGANHLTTVVTQAMDVLREAGAEDPAAVLRPLLTAALDNTLAFGDAALTGPVVRGDVTTIRAHVDALATADPATYDSYRALARATSVRAEKDGRLGSAAARDIRQVLREADWDTLAEIAAGI